MAGVAVSAIIAIGTTAYSTNRASSAQKKAAAEAKRLANLNAADEEALTAEEARRLASDQAVMESENLARAAASGVDISGSTSNLFLTEQKKENVRQLDWLKRSGLSRASITREGGASAYRTGRADASATQAQGLAQIGGIAGSAGEKWYANKQATP